MKRLLRDLYSRMDWEIIIAIVALLLTIGLALWDPVKPVVPSGPSGGVIEPVGSPDPAPSGGTVEAVMPYLIGLSAEEARDLVCSETEHLTLRGADGAEIPSLEGYVVVEQSPEAGTALTAETAVVLTCKSLEELQQTAVG